MGWEIGYIDAYRLSWCGSKDIVQDKQIEQITLDLDLPECPSGVRRLHRTERSFRGNEDNGKGFCLRICNMGRVSTEGP